MAQSGDLTVAGPGSPVSMTKVLDFIDNETPIKDQPSLMVLLDNSGSGIYHDSPQLVNIMITDRIEQCNYYLDNFFNGKNISAYLYRYIYWIMEEGCTDNPKYRNDQEIADAYNNKHLTAESDEYKKVLNYITYAKSNTEIMHIIGLVQLIGGALKEAAKQQSCLRIFIEQPETGFHPKRERCLVTILNRLRDEYGFKQVDEVI